MFPSQYLDTKLYFIDYYAIYYGKFSEDKLMAKEILSRFRSKEEAVELKFGPVSVSMGPQIYHDVRSMLPIQNTERNLEFAAEKGIKPLSLREIFSQIKPEELRNTVLFDTPPVPGFPGNHWRIIEINKEEESATLQLCGTFGNHDYDLIPPVNVPLDTLMFTGVSVQQFELGGLPASLRETVKAVEEAEKKDSFEYPKSLKHLGETILWPNSRGELVTADKHPVLLEGMKKATPEYRVQVNQRGNKKFAHLHIYKGVSFKRKVEIIAQHFGTTEDEIFEVLSDVRAFLEGEYNFSEGDFKDQWGRKPVHIFETRLTSLGISQYRADKLVSGVALERADSTYERETRDWEKEYWRLLDKLHTLIKSP